MRLRRFLIQLAAAAILVAPATAAQPTHSVFLDSVATLQEELDLLPLAGPDRASEPGFADNRSRLQFVDGRGAMHLRSIVAQGVQPSPTVVRTLGHLPVPTQGAEPPPAPGEYQAAIAELRQLHSIHGSKPGLAVGATQTGDPRGPFGLVAGVLLGGVLSTLGALAFWRWRRRTDPELLSIALTDALTGIGNRHSFEDDRDRTKVGPPTHVSVVMIDVDHFKAVNDQHGHAVGDDVLRSVGRVLANSVRPDDGVYRYGGEEFCAILRDTRLSEASIIAERVRQAVASAQHPHGLGITVSVGVACDLSGRLDRTIERADAALYEAKRTGRDRVHTSAPTVVRPTLEPSPRTASV